MGQQGECRRCQSEVTVDRECEAVPVQIVLVGGGAFAFRRCAAPLAVAEGRERTETYETHAKGIRILPGQWRPHDRFEQIAWVNLPWPCQDYIWLDFPEAIFSSLGLPLLSHVSPRFPAVLSRPPAGPLGVNRQPALLRAQTPQCVAFGGCLATGDPLVVEMELFIQNGAAEPIRDIRVQTCAYLRGVRGFSFFSTSIK
jgi:hypothetical protein